MHWKLTPLALLVALAVVPVSPAAAQVLPLQQDNLDQDRLRYNAEVFREYQEVLRGWGEAWMAEDARATARFYVDEATLVPSGGVVISGRRAIERALGELLPQRREMRTGLVDFEVRGNLLYGLGTFAYETGHADDEVRTVTGNYVVVMRRVGRSWRIRSQVFTPSTEG